MWSLSGREAIDSRTLEVVEEAESEIALLVVDEQLLSGALLEGLHEAVARDVSLVLGGRTAGLTDRLGSELPNARVFDTSLDFLIGADADHEVAISRILLVDRETLLIGSYYPDDSGGTEKAIFARGLENGIVVLLRRLVSSGLAEIRDPAQ